MTGTMPPGATVYHCPLPTCEWTFTQPPPDPFAPGVATGTALEKSIQRASAAIITEWLAVAERTLEAHLGTHTLLEWVREINRLNGIIGKVAAELADDGRIGSSLLTGAMATRANLAREECLDLLHTDTSAEKRQNLTAFVADLEREHGPVSEAELRDIRREWLG